MYDLSDFHSQLTDEQKDTLDNRINIKCILASAGSGKTRTLVHHIVDDINSGTPPSNIVAFTFTNKAADELLKRVKQVSKKVIPGVDINGIFIGTIHSWCLEFLSKQNKFINFTTLDELHQYSLISRLYDDLKIDELYKTTFPKGIKEFIKDIEIFFNENLEFNDLPKKLNPAISHYIETLLSNRILDFGSLIYFTIKELASSHDKPNILSLYVDEYQDVNPSQVILIQSMLLNSINAKSKLTVVGDDLQCIYNWRGSDVNRIIDFKHDFPINSEIYRLNYNFRSTESIVNVSNNFSNRISRRDKLKKLISKKKINDKKLLYVSSSDEITQANHIRDIIQNFLKNGCHASEIAILLRSVSNSSEEILISLENAGITVDCFLQKRSYKFVFEFIIPLLEWVSIPKSEPKNEEEEKEQEDTANNIWVNAKYFISDKDLKENIFWRAINHWKKEIDNKTNDSYNIRKQLYTFFDSIAIKIDFSSSDLAVSIGILSQIIRSNEEIHRRRLMNKDRKSVQQIYRECIDSIRFNYFDFGESLPLQHSSNGILVTTIHQSKGLEFPVVIIPMINRNKFPVRQKKHGTSYPDSVASRYGTSREDEKRLFYVAMTRAKDRLILLDTADSSLSDSSDFIQDIISDSSFQLSSIIPSDADSYWNFEHERNTDEQLQSIAISDILIYIDCPFQYALRRKGNIQPQIGDELGFGKGLHEVIQRIFLNKAEGIQEDIEITVNKYVHIPYQSQVKENESKKSITDRVMFLNSNNIFDLKLLPEEKFELYFENYIIEGIIDGIVKNNDNSVTIFDWKSNIHTKFEERYKTQMLLYALGLSRKGIKVKSAILIDVGESFNKGTIVKKEINLSDSDYEKIENDLKIYLQDLEAKKFEPKPSALACSSCDMNNICKHKF